MDDTLAPYTQPHPLHDKSAGELPQSLNKIELIQHETTTTTITTTTTTTILTSTPCNPSFGDATDTTDATPTEHPLTPELLTSAALFFDETIEEFENELVSDTNKLLEHPSSKEEGSQKERSRSKSGSPTLEVPPTKTPPSELVEYAANLAQRILNDATSTGFTFNVESCPQKLTLESVCETNKNNINKSETISKKVVQSEPDVKEKIAVKCVPQEILNFCETLANQILRDAKNIVVSTQNSKQSLNEVAKNKASSKIDPKDHQCQKDFVDTLPVITHFDSIRKNSEPNLTQQYSRLEISPVDDGSLSDPIELLEGYVTMAGDENGGKSGPRHKAFLKNLGCGVEITALDEDNSESQEKVSHRVMSMDSNDSIVTIKELDDIRQELEQSEFESDLKIRDTVISSEPILSPETSTAGTAVLISNETTNEPKPDLDPAIFLPSQTQLQSPTTTSWAESQKESGEIWPSENEDIKQILEQVIDQAESTVDQLQSQHQSMFGKELGESKSEASTNKQTQNLNQILEVSGSVEQQRQKFDLDFESAHPDTEIDAMYAFCADPEMELEFLPDVHPQSVPPITLESCTNPLKSSVMAALTTEPLIEASHPKLGDIMPKLDGGADELVSTKSENKECNLVALNNSPASELTQLLHEPLAESNRSAKRNEIAGDDAITAPREQEVGRKESGSGEKKAPGQNFKPYFSC